jgi:hypothetical protein
LWYDGNAELNTYTLDQNRYRETHPGESVLVQVTEHLDKAKHVKSDQASTEHSVPVMKTNLIERFHTGLYDYSLMTSVFTSTQAPFQTLKVTFSSQDWCGQSFSQLNWKNHEYYISKYSYFESIGDEDYKIGKALLEDEIFNLIRISPKLIPLGTISLIPSFKAQRLMHIPAAAITANITSHVNKDTTEIIIEMPEIKSV